MQGVINIFGDIGVDAALVDVIRQVKKQPEAESFIVNIDSPGGYLDEGFAIYDYLKSLKVPIHTKGRGVVASSATLPFLAGDTRSIYSGTQFMIHFPFISKLENAGSDDLDRISSLVKEDEKRLSKFYAEKTSIEENAIKSMLKNETFLTEDELFDLGFTTEKQSAKIAAKLIIDKNMTEKDKKQGKGLLDKIKALFEEHKISNKILFAADEREVEFPDVAEDAQIAVGDTVLVDGSKPADGSITLKDGRTIAIVDGKIDSIEDEENEEVENKVLTTSTGESIEFPDVEDGTEIAVGDAVLVGGEAPQDGVITLSDGRVLTVEAGKITAITNVEEILEEVQNLKLINKKMTTTLKEVEKFQSKLLNEKPNERKRVETPDLSWSKAINQIRKN